MYGCEVTSPDLPASLRKRLSRAQGSLTITATSSDNSVTSEPLDLTLLPSPYVHTTQIYLSTSEPAYIEVTATASTITYLQIKVSDLS